jgi:ceramide glucosyltransferase
LFDKRPLSDGLSLLPGTDDAADEARESLTRTDDALRSPAIGVDIDTTADPPRSREAMVNANLLLALAAAVAVGSTLFAMAALRWALRPRCSRSEFTPPITIFKPLKGIDEGLEENLRSFFRLDYPIYQLLFGVADTDDPAIVVVKRLLREFPEHDARLVAGCPVFGLNPKVENLAGMEPYRKHDTLLISDSNVRVRPSYLRETICYLNEPSVGLVTNLFAGVGERHSGAILENLQLNGFIAGGIAMAAATRITCVVGKSMLMPYRVLQAIGGLASVRNLLAEDQVIGLKVRQAGYSIRLSHHVVDNVNHSRTLRWFLNRHARWYKIRKQLALPAYLIEPLANLPAVGLLWVLMNPSMIGWLGLLLLLGLCLVRDALQTHWLRGSFPKFRHLLLSPVKDLLLLPVWFDALIDGRIHWRGHHFVIGRHTRLRLNRVSLKVRRRLRRVQRLRSLQSTRRTPQVPLVPPSAGTNDTNGEDSLNLRKKEVS